ncbi:MAG: sigma-54 dependent transcriptional regulator [Bacteroidetes bacterium]|nr:sigma-54 dependent transcriptional regulator [Bacteroidota bacterium]
MDNEKKILIVDDEASMRRNIVDLLSMKGYSLLEAKTGEEAIDMIESTTLDILILDINLPNMSGLEVLKLTKNNYPELPCIMLTAYGTSEKAIEAMKLGAFDYMEKPFELEEFIMIIERALKHSELLKELKQLRSKVSSSKSEEGSKIISKNSKMQEIFKTIGRISATDASVLIQGESGTGKELIADAIQRHSHLTDKPYVKINCGALSESLLESEIFGHEKGSFSGAESQRKGLFELANEGTVFLDEVNSMPPSLQVRLLRIIQGQSFFRVGGTTPLKVNVRIIAATNKDIEDEVKAGRFREDLYYRLNVARINIPPLRDRPDDIHVLIDYFFQKYSPTQKLILQEDSLQNILDYHWPGNVRELENTIHRASIMTTDNIIRIDKLPHETNRRTNLNATLQSYLNDKYSFKSIIADIEKKLLTEALKINNYNQSKTADYLKMNRRLLYSKVNEHSIIIK